MEAITVKELLAAVHGELLQGDETINVWVNYYFVMKQLRLCPII